MGNNSPSMGKQKMEARMAWKVDENGGFVAQDGAPIWIYEDGENKGSEAPVDFGKTLKSINDIKSESITRKNKLKELGEKYKAIDDLGVEDLSEWIVKANGAMEKVANLTDKEILDAGGIEKIKTQAAEVWQAKLNNTAKSYEEKLAEKEKAIMGKDGAIRNLIIRGAFDRSEFLRDRTVLPSNFAYADMGGRFVVEEVNGELKGFALDAEGNKLMSAKNPAEYADPDEAIELLVLSHPQKDRILKADASGGGAQNTNAGKASDLLAQYNDAKAKGQHAAMVSLKRRLHESGFKGVL